MADNIKNGSNALTSASDSKKRIWAIVGASSGNLVEWFDFYVYSFFSLYFAHIFFPQGDSTTQLLQTAGVFAVGFLMRPIGGWMFGYIADKHGRKKSMLISVCMMCFGSLVIACLPGFDSIGIAAPIILLLARMFQGLSVGGEYGTSATYMSEVALEGRKGFYASFHSFNKMLVSSFKIKSLIIDARATANLGPWTLDLEESTVTCVFLMKKSLK